MTDDTRHAVAKLSFLKTLPRKLERPMLLLSFAWFLVIIVELVALGAFIYRFSLDNQLQTLQTKIKQEQAIVVYQKDSESKYRNLQDRLALISSVSKATIGNLKIFNDIIALTPNGLTLNNFTLSEGKIQLEGNTNSVFTLSNFIDQLKAYPLIGSVSLDKIQNDTANSTITVGITVALKGQGGTNALSN